MVQATGGVPDVAAITRLLVGGVTQSQTDLAQRLIAANAAQDSSQRALSQDAQSVNQEGQGELLDALA